MKNLKDYPIVDEYCLKLQEYAISCAISHDMPDIDAYAYRFIEEQLYRLNMSMRIPIDVLQDRTEICRYPANNWEWLKQFIPFIKPKYRIHYINEHITFPKIKIPNKYQDEMRIYILTGIHTGNWEHI
jgi:hypothetical protein